MQRKMLVFIAALALPILSHAYTAGRYTNSTCTALFGTAAEVTVLTDACAFPLDGTSLKLPNNNCPLLGAFHADQYANAACTAPVAQANVVTSGQCFGSGVNWYKITCTLTDNTTTTTEMKFGLPWWFWLLLYCLLCCCCALCGGGGAIPFLGGKKKPTKKPAAATPSVVEEVVTVEDEVPLTSGYPTASMTVPMASYPGYPAAY
jgi:hypothetical protein